MPALPAPERSLSRRRSLPRPDPVALAAAGVFLFCWGLVHRWFWARGQIVDWPTYQRYGDAIVHGGQVPYRDFTPEYPPAALPVFAVPSLAGDYAQTFALLMAACGVLLVFVAGSVRRAALPFVAVSPLLVGALIYSRFDLWPALLVTAALLAFVRDRDRIGWRLLGVAVAAKLWPLVLVPFALTWSWRRGRDNAEVAGIVSAAICFVPFALLAPHGLWQSLHDQADRPLQIESLGAAFLTTFSHPDVITTHGSQNVAGYGWLAALLVAASALGLVALWVSFARGAVTRERLLRYAAAATCVVVAFAKVLSPQFLIWLVPLVPLVRGRRGVVATGVLSAALVLTQVWFPARYWEYALHFHLAGVVLARDLLLVALAGVLAWPSAADVDA